MPKRRVGPGRNVNWSGCLRDWRVCSRRMLATLPDDVKPKARSPARACDGSRLLDHGASCGSPLRNRCAPERRFQFSILLGTEVAVENAVTFPDPGSYQLLQLPVHLVPRFECVLLLISHGETGPPRHSERVGGEEMPLPIVNRVVAEAVGPVAPVKGN